MGGKAVLTVAATLALAPPASAAWTAPTEIPTPRTEFVQRPYSPGIAFTDAGLAGVSALTESRVEDAATDIVVAATPFGSDAFAPGIRARGAERLSSALNGNFALFGQAGIAFAGVTGDERPGVALRSFDRLRGRRIEVFLPHRRASASRAAGNARGDVAVATIATRRGQTQGHPMAPYLVIKRPGRRLGTPIRLDRFGRASVYFDVAVNARGDVLVAWQRGRYLWARMLPRGGKLGPRQRLWRARRPYVRAVLTTGRRALVAWASFDRRQIKVRYAQAGPGGRFALAVTVGDSDYGPDRIQCLRTVDVGFAPGFVPIVAWTDRDVDRLVVITSIGGAVQTHASPGLNACLGDLAFDIDGAATVAWWEGDADDLYFSLRAASAAPGGSFGPSEPIAANARAAVFAAADPRTRRVTAVWADGNGTLMSATRDP
jgi:hypothetical protein